MGAPDLPKPAARLGENFAGASEQLFAAEPADSDEFTVIARISTFFSDFNQKIDHFDNSGFAEFFQNQQVNVASY